jgi:hypothetical protein
MPPRNFHHLIKDSASVDRDYTTDNPAAASMATHDLLATKMEVEVFPCVDLLARISLYSLRTYSSTPHPPSGSTQHTRYRYLKIY